MGLGRRPAGRRPTRARPEGGGGPTAPPTDLFNGVWGLWPLSVKKPELRVGSMGDAVLYVQSVIFHCAGGGIAATRSSVSTRSDGCAICNVSSASTPTARSARGTWPIVDGLATLMPSH